MKYFFGLIIFAGALLAQAVLYVPGAGLWEHTPISDYGLGSSTEPFGGDGEGASVYLDILFLDAYQSILTVNDTYYGTGGIRHVWYEVAENIIFDEAYTTANTPFFDAADLSSIGQITMTDYQPFFMGFWLDADVPIGDGQPGLGDVFGWAELVYDGTTLSLVDSAAENDGVGIIAGQYQQVPEPATLLLFGIGGVGAWLLRRNSKHAPKLT